MRVFKVIVLLIVVAIIAFAVSAYSSASVTNAANVSVVESKNALVAVTTTGTVIVPQGDVALDAKPMKVKNNFSAPAKVTVKLAEDPHRLGTGLAWERTLSPGDEAEAELDFTGENKDEGTYQVKYQVRAEADNVTADIYTTGDIKVQAVITGTLTDTVSLTKTVDLPALLKRPSMISVGPSPSEAPVR